MKEIYEWLKKQKGQSQLTFEKLEEKTTLSLYYCDIYTLPECIGQLKHIERLYLHGNFLTSIPEGVFEMESLEVLDVRSNNIVSISRRMCRLLISKGSNYDQDKIELETNSLDYIKGCA